MSRRAAFVRVAIGFGISGVSIVLTVSRVNALGVAAALGAAIPQLLGLAVVVVLVDLLIRSVRWRLLVRGIAPSTAPSPLIVVGAYLTVGYLANNLLPARLGDLIRAYLASLAFRTGRLAALGTIMVERVLDGTAMLMLVLVSGFALGGPRDLSDLIRLGLAVALLASVGLGVAMYLARTTVGRGGLGARIRGVVGRLYGGTIAIRSPRGAAMAVATTACAAGTATLVALISTGATGIALTPLEAVLLASGLALSLAIPAAPGSWGTYELAGVTILGSLGFDGDRALAAILVMRIVSTLPPALLGAVSVFALNLRPASVRGLPAFLSSEQGGAADADDLVPAVPSMR